LETIQPLLTVLLVAASIVCAVAVWALVELARTARSTRSLADDTHVRLIPLMDKVDVTVDAINAELLRIDAIITQVEEASARVSHASDTISGIVNTPAEIVNDMATRVRRVWKDRRRSAEQVAEEQRGEEDDDRLAEQTADRPLDDESVSRERADEAFPTELTAAEPTPGERPPEGQAGHGPPIVDETPA